MPIKTQKMIRFVPIANFIITVFLWFRMYHNNPIPKKRMYKKLGVIALFVILIMIVEIVLKSIIKNDMIGIFINLMASYLQLFAFSCVAVYDQEQYFNKQNNKIDFDSKP